MIVIVTKINLTYIMNNIKSNSIYQILAVSDLARERCYSFLRYSNKLLPTTKIRCIEIEYKKKKITLFLFRMRNSGFFHDFSVGTKFTKSANLDC
jgi:hypothetical protein